jgi:hypothetical protein
LVEKGLDGGPVTGGAFRRIYLTTGNRQPEAEALHLATGYLRLVAPLPAGGIRLAPPARAAVLDPDGTGRGPSRIRAR